MRSLPVCLRALHEDCNKEWVIFKREVIVKWCRSSTCCIGLTQLRRRCNAAVAFNQLPVSVRACKHRASVTAILSFTRDNKLCWADTNSPEGSYCRSCARRGRAEDLSCWHYYREVTDLSFSPWNAQEIYCLTVAVKCQKRVVLQVPAHFSPTCFVHMYLFIMLLLQKKKKNSMY